MLYAYATRFDVIRNLEKFLVFLGELNKAFVPDADALILLPISECGCSLFPFSECKPKFSQDNKYCGHLFY